MEASRPAGLGIEDRARTPMPSSRRHQATSSASAAGLAASPSSDIASIRASDSAALHTCTLSTNPW